jgi:hypothetical protein
MIGSRVRAAGDIASADEMSDWDFHVVTTRPDLFFTLAWTRSAGLSHPLAYVARSGRLANVTKVSAVFAKGQFDLVLLPASQVRLLKWLFSLGLAGRIPRARTALADLALVLQPGFRNLKGPPSWRRFFEQIVLKIDRPRLSDDAICDIANGFVCDCVSTRHKVDRGEFLAAQRWLHCQLAETNFRLLHELKLRLEEPTYPDARRIELVIRDHWREAVTVAALCDRQSLNNAVERSSQTCRDLVEALIGSKWSWPELPPRLS